MSRIPRDILERLGYFQSEVEQLFRRLFMDERDDGSLPAGTTFPLIDVIECADEIRVRADLPGVERDSIELYAAPSFLVIRGTKVAPLERWTYLRVERTFGGFQRLVALPGSADTGQVNARLDRGVLEINIPKLAERRRGHRKIPID